MNSLLVKKLVYYGKKHLGLNDLDAVYVSNILYRKLKIQYSEDTCDFSYIDDLKVPDVLLDELRELELDNIRTLSQRMVEVQEELRITHKNEKIQQAYEFDETLKGNIINVEEWCNIVLSSFLGALFIVFVFCCDYINAYNSDDIIFFAKKVLALLIFICIIVFVEMRKEFYHEQRRISTRNFKKS